jgi:hypothetical protein
MARAQMRSSAGGTSGQSARADDVARAVSGAGPDSAELLCPGVTVSTWSAGSLAPVTIMPPKLSRPFPGKRREERNRWASSRATRPSPWEVQPRA